MTKNKPVLPNMTWQPIPTFDPATIAAPAPATAPLSAPAPAPMDDMDCSTITTATDATATPAPAPAPKRKATTAKKTPMRQRGLHLEDGTILKLRIEALQRGMTASRLANQILSKALAS
jgi:hypothetical protein